MSKSIIGSPKKFIANTPNSMVNVASNNYKDIKQAFCGPHAARQQSLRDPRYVQNGKIYQKTSFTSYLSTFATLARGPPEI